MWGEVSGKCHTDMGLHGRSLRGGHIQGGYMARHGVVDQGTGLDRSGYHFLANPSVLLRTSTSWDPISAHISTLPHTQSAVSLKSESYVRSLAWDPQGSFLAASVAGGYFSVYEREEGGDGGVKRLFQRRKAAKADYMSTYRCDVAWHPDGSILAVPGSENDVVLYERLSWEQTQVSLPPIPLSIRLLNLC